MSIEKSPVKSTCYAPENEFQYGQTPTPHWGRGLLKILLAVGLLLLWAYCSKSCLSNPEGNPSANNYDGSSAAAQSSGHGSGSGDSGSGPGAGENGFGNSKNSDSMSSDNGPSTVESESTANGTNPQPQTSSNNNRNSNLVSAKNSSDNDRQNAQAIIIPVESLARPVIPSDPNSSGSAALASGRKGFYGAPVPHGGKVLFLVDTSGSMASLSSEIPGKTRLEVLKMELKKSLFNGDKPNRISYRKSGGFIIISFSDSHKRYPAEKLCRYRNPEAMKEANEFIDNQLKTGGGTMMRQAWTAAIKAAAVENIDTIYFLTDGQSGDNLTFEWLQQELSGKLSAKVKLHCIALGIDQDFMRRIATARNGEYIFIP